MLVLAVTAALASAGAYAAGAVSQRRLALAGRSLTPWRAAPALALNLLGAGLHVLALRWGPLTLVQALGAVALVFALPASARLGGRRVTVVEWRAAAMVVVGLDVVVVACRGSGVSREMTDLEAGRSVATVVALTAVLVLVARRAGPRASGVLLAVAGGATSAVASALTQTAGQRITSAGLADPVLLLVLAGIGVLAVSGLALAQLAYRGDLGAPLATSTLTNAAVAAALGTVVLGEQLGSGPAELALAGVAALMAGWGVVLLTRTAPDTTAHTPLTECAHPAPGHGLPSSHPSHQMEPDDHERQDQARRRPAS